MRSVLAVAGLMAAGAAHGLINPNFTPGNLVDESQQILLLTLKAAADGLTFTAVEQVALKGDKLAKLPTIDAKEALNEETGTYLLKHLAEAGGSPALLFVGQFSDDTANVEAADEDESKLFLHIGGKWIDLESGEGDGVYSMIMANSHMEATWAGGSDMLLRAVKLRLADETVDFPAVVGSEWRKPVNIGSVAEMQRIRAVDFGGEGKQVLVVFSTQGDRLFAYDEGAKKLVDVTAAKKLATKSKAAAWGDFNGDGRLDMASYDGQGLHLALQNADGTFTAQAVKLEAAAAAAARVLATIAVGPAGDKAGLVLGGAPVALVVADLTAEAPTAVPLPSGEVKELEALGNPFECLIADFDDDGVADLLHLFERGSLLYKGKAPGDFAVPTKAAPAGGTASRSACIADFDGDNRFDVFTVSEEGSRIWQNEGAGLFKEYVNLSGEIAYISKPNSIDCATCDVNNDGLQDVFIAYADQGAQLFFNRGYRSFGHAHEMDLTERQLLEAAESGQVAGFVADLDHDGAQDMVLGLANGEVWFFQRNTDDSEALAAVGALPFAGTFKGPVKVSATFGERTLGAWNVMPGTGEAFFGSRDAGIVNVQWQLPGAAAPVQRKIRLENRVRRFEVK